MYLDEPKKYEQYRDQVSLLSGPRSWSLDQAVKLVGEATRIDIDVRECSIDEYSHQPQVLEALGLHRPGEVTKQWVTIYDALRDGETAVVLPLLETLIGRELECFEMTVRDMLKT